MTAGRTGGDWYLDSTGRVFAVEGGRRVEVARVSGDVHAIAANGRLIAAAPSLEAALELLVQRFDRWDPPGGRHPNNAKLFERARAALRKANP